MRIFRKCFWGHTWGKWEALEKRLGFYRDKPEVKFDILEQQRQCSECGLIQRREI